MSVTDDILDFIYQTTGKVADKASPLVRQIVAVVALAGANRFVPHRVQGLFFNRGTQAAAGYITRHPLATLAAYGAAEYRNSGYRAQWAGDWTRPLETAILTPIFGQSPAILRWLSRQLGTVLRPELAQRGGGVLRFLSAAKIPQVPPWVINNRGTRGVVNYLARHPAALLASYFTANYVDRTYRPQFFGMFSQEVIGLGSFFAYAHAPGVIPPLLRGLGTGVYYGTRGAASGLEFMLRRPTTPNAVTANSLRSGRIGKNGLVVLAALAAEAWNAAERARAEDAGVSPWLYARWKGVGAITSTLILGHPRLFNTVPVSVAVIERYLRRNIPIWSTRYPGFSSVITRILDFKYSPAFPRIAGWVVKGSWGGTFLLKALLPLQAIGINLVAPWVSSIIVKTTVAGYFAPFFRTGSLRGGLVEVGGWAKGAYQAYVAPLAFLKHEWKTVTSGIAKFAVFNFAPALGNTLRVAGPIARQAAQTTGQLLSGTIRGLGSAPAQAALIAIDAVELQALSDNVDLMERELFERVGNALNRLAELQEQGLYWGPDPNIVGQIITRNYRAQRSRYPIDFWLRNLDYVNSLILFTPQQSNYDQLGGILATAGEGFWNLAGNVGGFLDRQFNRNWYFQGTRWGGAVLKKNGWATQPRDALGRFIKKSFAYTTAQPGVPTGLAQALAYVAKLRQLIIQKIRQSRTTGQHSHGPSLGGHTGHKGREFWLYRGRDRNLLLQTHRDLVEVVERDAFEATGKTTTTISVREPIFDPLVPGLSGAVKVVIRRLYYDYHLVRKRGPGGGYYFLDDEEL